MLDLKIQKLSPNAQIPSYKTKGSAGMDICALIEQQHKNQEITINPNETAIIPTGIAMELPMGFEAQIRPRSGFAAKYSITVTNSPGTIDSDYRGEIKVILTNHGKEPFIVTNGMRIAQCIIAKYEQPNIKIVEELSDTKRSDKGFGSTGTH